MLDKFVRGMHDIHVFSNTASGIPEWCTTHVYDEKFNWSQRILQCIDDSSEYVLFLHEDWIPIDILYPRITNSCVDFMKQIDCGYLLSYASRYVRKQGITYSTRIPGYDFTPISNFLLQPAIWKTSVLKQLCSFEFPLKNIEINPACRDLMSKQNCYAIMNTYCEKYETTKAFLFPHIHAVIQQKWTLNKYPTLGIMLDYYGIDYKVRGVETTWELYTQ